MLPTESSVKVPAVIRPCLVPSMVMYAGVGMLLSLTVDGSGSALPCNRIGAIAVPPQEISMRNKGLRFFPGPVQLRFGETVNGSTGQCATSCAALAGYGADGS